eukprot:COSAG02_NODE_45103_length_360_cov_0.785441_1_plen_33_part_01
MCRDQLMIRYKLIHGRLTPRDSVLKRSRVAAGV